MTDDPPRPRRRDLPAGEGVAAGFLIVLTALLCGAGLFLFWAVRLTPAPPAPAPRVVVTPTPTPYPSNWKAPTP